MMKNSKGFTVIEIAIALVVIGALAFGGYTVWHKSKTTSDESKANTTQSYLVVHEWGIKIPLTNDTKDAYYVLNKGVSDPTLNISILALKGKDYCGAESTNPPVVLTRYRAMDKVTQPGGGTDETLTWKDFLDGTPYRYGATLGEYAYHMEGMQAMCAVSRGGDIDRLSGNARQAYLEKSFDITAL